MPPLAHSHTVATLWWREERERERDKEKTSETETVTYCSERCLNSSDLFALVSCVLFTVCFLLPLTVNIPRQGGTRWETEEGRVCFPHFHLIFYSWTVASTLPLCHCLFPFSIHLSHASSSFLSLTLPLFLSLLLPFRFLFALLNASHSVSLYSFPFPLCAACNTVSALSCCCFCRISRWLFVQRDLIK